MSDESAQHIETEAISWVARMDADGWGAADEAELSSWLNGNPRRRGALLQTQAAWMWLDPTAHADAGIDAEMAPPAVKLRPILRNPLGRLSRRRVLAGGGGIALLAAAGASLALFGRGQTYQTGMGELRRDSLADGSLATINTTSRLQVVVTSKVRRILLVRGEAWFDVKKDPSRPFLVEVDGLTVRATGTAFSVRRRETGTDIYVTEGSVEVTAPGRPAVALPAGSGMRFDEGSPAKPLANDMDRIDHVLAWRSGELVLDEEPLGTAVEEFNRYNLRQIIITDPALLSEQLDGKFRTDHPEEFAQALQSTLGVTVDLSRPDRIVIGP